MLYYVVYSTRQLGEFGDDSHHLMWRRKPISKSGKDKYFERGVEKEEKRWRVSIGVKCGSIDRQRKEPKKKSIEKGQIRSQIQV